MTWDRRLYFPSEGRCAENFFALKIRRLRPGANPRTWVSKASTLPLDHWSRFDNDDAVGMATATPRLCDSVMDSTTTTESENAQEKPQELTQLQWQCDSSTTQQSISERFLELNVLFYMFIELQYKHSIFIFAIKHIWCASFLLQCSDTFNALGTAVYHIPV
jgi:hypothetical protein